MYWIFNDQFYQLKYKATEMAIGIIIKFFSIALWQGKTSAQEEIFSYEE